MTMSRQYTDPEKQMLRTAKKLRNLVYADFMTKTANPIALLGRALLPALRTLGPKVLSLVKNIPPEAWAQIIPALIGQLGPKAPAKSTKSAAKKETHGTATRVTAGMTKRLRRAGVKHPEVVARLLFLAAVETGSSHRKKANPVVVKALRGLNKVQRELRTIREFY